MGVEIVKVDEKVVRECKMVQETEVDLSGLGSGVYFLRVVGREEGGAGEVSLLGFGSEIVGY